jgi:dihydroflavonol-4-reductase
VRVLLTGADGLLGSYTVRRLLEKGVEVRIFKQPGSNSPTLDNLPIEMVEGDLLDEGGALSRAAKGCDCVFHIAAITDFWAPRDITFRVNLDGTQKVIDACIANDVRRLIFVGSASSYQFGTIENPGDETAPFPSVYKGRPYMESKFEAMKLVKHYVDEGKLDAVIISPTFMLGRYDWRPSSGELIRQFVIRRMKLSPPGGRNFVFAGDVADALVAAMDKGAPGESYLGAGTNLRNLDFFGKVAPLVGLEPPKRAIPPAVMKGAGVVGSVWQAVSRRPVKVTYSLARLFSYGTYYSPKKAIEQLGMPQTPIDHAIAETVAGLKEFGHIPK